MSDAMQMQQANIELDARAKEACKLVYGPGIAKLKSEVAKQSGWSDLLHKLTLRPSPKDGLKAIISGEEGREVNCVAQVKEAQHLKRMR